MLPNTQNFKFLYALDLRFKGSRKPPAVTAKQAETHTFEVKNVS